MTLSTYDVLLDLGKGITYGTQCEEGHREWARVRTTAATTLLHTILGLFDLYSPAIDRIRLIEPIIRFLHESRGNHCVSTTF